MIEQRKSKRFELKLPLRLIRNGARLLSGLGETVNLSSHGVLFASDTEVPIDEPIEYVITMPASEAAAVPVDLHCLGKVVRSERQAAEGPYCEIAATLERYEFVRLQAPEPVGSSASVAR